MPKLENMFGDDNEHVPKLEKLDTMFEEAPQEEHQPQIEDFEFFPDTQVQEGGGMLHGFFLQVLIVKKNLSVATA